VQGLSHASDAQLTGVKQPTTLLWGDADRSHKLRIAATFPTSNSRRFYVELALSSLNA
jgi:glutamine synthetase